MLDIVELDPLSFSRILHAVLRADDTTEEVTRAIDVLKWVTENRPLLGKTMLNSQLRLFGLIQRHFTNHKSPTNRAGAEDLARKEDKPDGLLDLLEQYDTALPYMRVTGALDMPQLMENHTADWEKVAFQTIALQSMQISEGALEPNKGEPHLKGARDATDFFLDAIHSGAIVSDVRTVGGSVKKNLPSIMSDYEQNKSDRLTERLQIKTELACLDNTIRGFRKPEFIGVLGYAGNFKTTLCRTFLYNAALQGFNCLHIPLESTYKEELALYAIMHAHNGKFRGYTPLTTTKNICRSDFEDGDMTVEQERFLQDRAIPDFQQHIRGNILIRQPAVGSWAEMKQLIELADREKPLDVVLIDYLALMDVADSRNPTQTINETIKQVKSLCLTFRGGAGLAIITPVQGKRDGYEQAKANGGMWSSDGAYMYSEFEKSLDKMIYIYTDDDLKQAGTAKIGACKSRRTIDAPATIVSRHLLSGRITDSAPNDLLTNNQQYQPGTTKEDWG